MPDPWRRFPPAYSRHHHYHSTLTPTIIVYDIGYMYTLCNTPLKLHIWNSQYTQNFYLLITVYFFMGYLDKNLYNQSIYQPTDEPLNQVKLYSS